MYECMHVCMYYVCMRLCTPIGAPRRSLIGALIGAPVDVSQVKYAHIENVCIYRRADYTGSQYMYVCMHIRMYYVYMYVCTPIGAPLLADR